jgi:MYXO-CTERM domain-containing protein
VESGRTRVGNGRSCIGCAVSPGGERAGALVALVAFAALAARRRP